MAMSVALFAILVLDHSRSIRELKSAIAEVDTLRHRVQIDRASRDSLLSPGDELPDVPVLQASGDTSSLIELVRSGPHFVYFSRDDCVPCQQFDVVLATLVPSAQRQILVVSTRPEDATETPAGPARVRIARRGLLGKRIQGVPSLVHVSTDGFVLSVSHASFVRAMRMMGAFGLAPRAVIDSAIARALPRLKPDAGGERGSGGGRPERAER